MQTNIDLQAPFSYSIYPILIILILILMITIYLVMTRKKKIKQEVEVKIKEPKKDIASIKKKYIKKIENVELKLENNKISIRVAYQSLSSIIRYFVFEMTNIEVQNCTLREIRKLNMPALTELIQEYYAPEFAEHSLGNIKSSLEKTRKVIEKWN